MNYSAEPIRVLPPAEAIAAFLKKQRDLVVLVCGGREYADRLRLDSVLNELHFSHRIACVVAGGARGADELAKQWADSHKVLRRIFPADWTKYGASAGPIRNKRMLDEGRPDLVVAFPGGRGTASMIDLAEKAHVQLLEVR